MIDITDHPKLTLFSDPGRSNEVAWEVNRTLEDIFRIERISGGDGLNRLLEYESHFVEERDGRKVLKLGIKAAVDDTSALSEVITEFCQKLFTEEGSMLLDRISYAGIFGISPRQGTVFERIWVRTFAVGVLKERGRLERIGLVRKDYTRTMPHENLLLPIHNLHFLPPRLLERRIPHKLLRHPWIME